MAVFVTNAGSIKKPNEHNSIDNKFIYFGKKRTYLESLKVCVVSRFSHKTKPADPKRERLSHSFLVSQAPHD